MTKINYSIKERLNVSVIARKSEISVKGKVFEGQIGKEKVDEEIEL